MKAAAEANFEKKSPKEQNHQRSKELEDLFTERQTLKNEANFTKLGKQRTT